MTAIDSKDAMAYTCNYAPLEIFDQDFSNLVASDIYSLGMSFWHVLHSQTPFDGLELNAIAYNLVNNKFPPINQDIYQIEMLINGCCAKNKGNRMNMQEIMQLLDTFEKQVKTSSMYDLNSKSNDEIANSIVKCKLIGDEALAIVNSGYFKDDQSKKIAIKQYTYNQATAHMFKVEIEFLR